ncbi:MAG: ABC transporter ATP-binding protein [Spirochaetales bacterium]|nr:ABC transporter ATP-binding protein [Spirochaetales bacterium]
MKLGKMSDLVLGLVSMKKHFALLVLLTFSSAALSIISVYLIRLLYDQVYAVFSERLLYRIIALNLLVFLLLAALNGVRRILVTSVRFHLLEKVRLGLIDDIVHYEYRYFVKTNSNDFMNRLAEDCDLAVEGMAMVISAVLNILTIITWLCYFFILVRWVFLVYVVFTVMVIGWVFVWRYRLQKTSYEIGLQYSKLYGFFWMIISGIKMIKFELLDNFVSGLLERRSKGLDRAFRQNHVYSNILWAFITPMTWAVFIFILYFGVSEIQTGSMTVGMLTFCIMFIWKLAEPINDFNVILTNIQKAESALQRIGEYTDGLRETGGERKFNGISTAIEFRNVCFKYENSRFALKKLNFRIGRGESVAIIGKSGIGKSSIANLLVKLYSAASGKILLDGISIDEFTLESLRDNIAIVPQTITLYPVSLKKNINIKDRLQETGVSEILKKLDLHKLMAKREDGIDSFVRENGIEFSGGERQRIGLARALALKAGIYIFDEVTANIDPATEKRALDAIFSLDRDVTRIFITHNLEIISRMDRVFLLSDGGIRELSDSEKKLETAKLVCLYDT